jgi:hypothetical protein
VRSTSCPSGSSVSRDGGQEVGRTAAKPCAGRDTSQSEQIEAIAVLGKSVELATSLKERVEALSDLGRLPIAPHRPGFDLDAWMLVAYLIEERRPHRVSTRPQRGRQAISDV